MNKTPPHVKGTPANSGGAQQTSKPFAEQRTARILFVDDDLDVLDALRDATRSRRRDWDIVFASSGMAALDQLGDARVDVVVSDMRMPGMDGAELLAHVQEVQPDAVRIVLSGYADSEVLARASSIAHRFLAKPCQREELTRVIERSVALHNILNNMNLRRDTIGAAALPSRPGIYTELAAILHSGHGGDLDEIAAIVERDAAICAKVMQLANSAFFGSGRRVSRVRDAIALLGLKTLGALVLSAETFAKFNPSDPGASFDMTKFQRHATTVAYIAGQIQPSGQVHDDAVTAGLLHDIGQLLLATHEPDSFADVLASAGDSHRPLAQMEQERQGFTHAEVGAHLLDLWGLPHTIVEAVAYHENPGNVLDPEFDAIAAVHIAEALAHQLDDDDIPRLDVTYTKKLGLTDEVAHWRESFRELATLGT